MVPFFTDGSRGGRNQIRKEELVKQYVRVQSKVHYPYHWGNCCTLYCKAYPTLLVSPYCQHWGGTTAMLPAWALEGALVPGGWWVCCSLAKQPFWARWEGIPRWGRDGAEAGPPMTLYHRFPTSGARTDSEALTFVLAGWIASTEVSRPVICPASLPWVKGTLQRLLRLPGCLRMQQ